MRTFVSLFIAGIALLCVGGAVLAVGLLYGGGLADSCENGCADMWLLRTVFAAPGALIVLLGLLALVAAAVRGRWP